MKEKGLTIKQEKFVEKYLETGNASESYRYAYNSLKMKPETVQRKACELLKNGKITARVEQKQKELQKSGEITKKNVLEELKNILYADIRDYVDFDGKKLVFKPFSELTESQAKAIESVKTGKYGVELKLHGKSWTIERICKIMGFDQNAKLDITTGGEKMTLNIEVVETHTTVEEF